MEYSRNYLIHYYEIDTRRRLTLPSLIHYFEDLAMLNSEAQGMTLDYYDKNERGWMLYKWDIKIFRYPMFNETIKIVTHPSAFKNFLANREYKIFDLTGKQLVEANSVWLFADTKTRRPLRVPEEMYTRFDVPIESELLFDKLEDIPPISSGDYSLKVEVKNSDIDTNHHVNNVKYIEWVLESLPVEFTDSHYITRIIVNYKKELNLNDEAEILSSVAEDNHFIVSDHTIVNNGKDVCNVKFHWNLNEE